MITDVHCYRDDRSHEWVIQIRKPGGRFPVMRMNQFFAGEAAKDIARNLATFLEVPLCFQDTPPVEGDKT